MFNFNLILFYFIIITDAIVILRCYIGSLMEMNQLFFIFGLLNMLNRFMWQVLLSPGQMLLTSCNTYVGLVLCH